MVKAKCTECGNIVSCNLNGIENKGIEIASFIAHCTECGKRTERRILKKEADVLLYECYTLQGHPMHISNPHFSARVDLVSDHGNVYGRFMVYRQGGCTDES